MDTPGVIAIVGMAGRFPGARNVEELWANLRGGVESITFFLPGGREAWQPPEASAFRVPAKGVIDAEIWDAEFFAVSRREAEMMDPQQRLFVECAWEALEHAGYDSQQYPGKIGVFGGVSKRDYVIRLARAGMMADPETSWFVQVGNEPDLLTTRTAFKLGLEGPSINVQNGCASGLVALHFACNSLLAGECAMALAGASSISGEQRSGAAYHLGSNLSPSGRCRSFDARCDGTVDSDGVAVVVLKRLEDALADGDHIHAVVRGSALGNDGADRGGLMVPRMAGRARVIREALDRAGVSPETVSYVEAHGNGTPLGDSIEVAALIQAFRSGTDRRGFCAIGSTKPNLGHTNAAAGVIGLIKTALALEHCELPASLHYEQPLPEIDFAASPFFVNDRLRPWEANGVPRYALINAFGAGGLNAHVVLEEAPPPADPAQSSRPWQLLTLSAKTPTALEAATVNLAAHFEAHPGTSLPDAAWTLQTGRRAFEHRRTVLCRDVEEAVKALRTLDPVLVATYLIRRREPPVAFLLPANPAPLGLSAGSYAEEPGFREEVERCGSFLRPHLGRRLRETLLDGAALDDPDLAELALFVLQYAIGRLWITWGLTPQALLGEGVGEYTAACLGGVSPLEDTLALLAARGVQPGRFADALETPADAPDRLVLEVSAETNPLEVLARAWREGAKIDWHSVHTGEQRRRLALPTYPFERQRYWVDVVQDSNPFLDQLVDFSNASAFDD